MRKVHFDTRTHYPCINIEKGNNRTIECLKIKKGEEWDKEVIENKILFVIEGKLRFSFGEYIDKEIPQGKMMILPCGNHCIFKAEENLFVIICKLRTKLQFCERLPIHKLSGQRNREESELQFLDIHEHLHGYIQWLNVFVEEGLNCMYFSDIKIRELLYLLRAYYSLRDLQGFFYPLLNNDINFSEFVFNNYKKVKTVKEFADLANYSISGFEKKFKKVFGASAYHWMKEKRAQNIYHEINAGKKALKEICWDQGFSSLSQFNDFCKLHFGKPPGKIRNEKMEQ